MNTPQPNHALQRFEVAGRGKGLANRQIVLAGADEPTVFAEFLSGASRHARI